jgi:Holliday junction resolvasome RuvABC endonuclease subunit
MISTTPTILGLDPGTRFLGAAVLRRRELVAYGVHELKNGRRPYDVIGQARRVVFGYIEQYGPQVVAIEAPYLIATKRGAVLTTLAQELHERSKELGLEVVELSPEDVRKVVVGKERATKIDVAEGLVTRGFTELRSLVPKRPARPALGLRPRDRYWLHAFDALALAVAAPGSVLGTRRDR